MNERIKIKVKQMLNRGAKGLLRFRAAFLLSLLLFLIVFCRVAYMPGETDFDKLFPVSLGYILISLGSTILFPYFGGFCLNGSIRFPCFMRR